mgnify:CR=1 FL=1|jgi:regulator of nucleoside diphosphate kinase
MVKQIYITELDKVRLQKLISNALEYNLCKKDYLKRLDQELQRALVVSSKDIPNDIITMNSSVALVDMETNEEMIYTLVFPDDADLLENKISILAPIGTAILGYRVGDIVEWPVPDGIIKLKVDRIVFQPEATGNYTL